MQFMNFFDLYHLNRSTVREKFETTGKILIYIIRIFKKLLLFGGYSNI